MSSNEDDDIVGVLNTVMVVMSGVQNEAANTYDIGSSS